MPSPELNPLAPPYRGPPKKPEADLVEEWLGPELKKAFIETVGSRPSKEDTQEDLKVSKEDIEKAKKNLEESIATIEDARKFLGRENVHGQKDVEFLLGFTLNPKDIPPIPYTIADLKKSKEIKEKTGVEEMLVLFVHGPDGKPLTGETLNVLIQKKYTEMGLGKFLFSVSWYANEDFYKNLGLKSEWKLISKQCIPNSKNKRHHFEEGDDTRTDDPFTHEDTQEFAIEQFAKDIGVQRDQLHRPEPCQMLYATALHLVSTEALNGKDKGERLLVNEWHWSDRRSSDGGFVHVGRANDGGAIVQRNSRGHWRGSLSVCFSRDPSEKSLDIDP